MKSREQMIRSLVASDCEDSFSKSCICRHGGSACTLSKNVDKTEASCLLGQPDLHVEAVSKPKQESCVYGITFEKSHLHLELTSITRALK